MADLIWTNEAHDWLESIYHYIAQDNPEAVHRVVSGIYNKAQVLRHYPRLGQR